MELSQGWSGKLVEQGSKERPVRRGEPWLIDSALQDGALVASRENLDVFIGVAHWQ